MMWIAPMAQISAAMEPSSSPANGKTTETVVVFVGQSRSVQTPWPAKNVAVTDPKVADVQVLSPQEVLIQGKATGTTDVIIWNDSVLNKTVRVDVELDPERISADLARINADLARIFPQVSLNVSQSAGILMVQGNLDTVDRATALRQYLEETDMKYVDMTRVAGLQQVLLRVRVAEVSRSALRLLGFNAYGGGNDFFGANVVGTSTGPLQPVSIGAPGGALATHPVPFMFTQDVSTSPAVTLFGGFPRADFQFFLQALAENQYMRLLAEPTLVTLSGEEASFLVGGEVPIPTVQSGATGGGPTVTVLWKEFGVRLLFKPVVLGENTIRLDVAPEVSELTSVGALSIQGFNLPALSTRKARATLEMKSGESFAMAGLISNSMSGRISKIPLLGDIPVLGALFRSTRYQQQDTELVVIVTASLVEPTNAVNLPPLPGALSAAPNDWELYLEGRMESKETAKLSATDADYLKKMGLSKLSGPGAWQDTDEGMAQSRATLRPDLNGEAEAPAAADEQAVPPANEEQPAAPAEQPTTVTP